MFLALTRPDQFPRAIFFIRPPINGPNYMYEKLFSDQFHAGRIQHIDVKLAKAFRIVLVVKKIPLMMRISANMVSVVPPST